MALLPLALPPAAGLAISMSSVGERTPGNFRGARRAARAVAEVVRECSYAQQRMLELRIFGREGDEAPDTYAEFLFRSRMALWREPSARRREKGARPRR
jgi:hypothetical protein